MKRASDEIVSDGGKAVIALGPAVREAADEIERERCLPPRIVEALKQAGVFGIAQPRAWGGSELDLPEQLRVLEVLSWFDGSVGWCATIGGGGGFLSAWLPDDIGRELFGSADGIAAGSILFAGKAQKVDGGFRVNRTWPFSSGCQHATVFALTCHIVDEKGKAVVRPNGIPEMRI